MSDTDQIIDVHQAISRAKHYVTDLFSSEPVTDIGLEEVVHDYDGWKVTIGFYRRPPAQQGALLGLAHLDLPRRSYKVVTVSDKDGSLISVKNRDSLAE